MVIRTLGSALALGFGCLSQAMPTFRPSDGIGQEEKANHKISTEDRAKALEMLDKKSAALEMLRKRANVATSKIAEVAESGDVTSDDAIKVLQDMVQEQGKSQPSPIETITAS